MKITDRPLPTMTRDEMADDYPRLKREYTLLHEDYRRLQAEKDKQLKLYDVVGRSEQLCECYDSHESNEVEIVEICCRCKKPTT